MRLVAYVIVAGIFTFSACQSPSSPSPASPQKRQSGAAESLDQWSCIRIGENGQISLSEWTRAFWSKREASLRQDDPEWSPIGPSNIGGRTLCLAFHPDQPSTVYAGSASGGLWVTYTAGKGPAAWERIPIGFPVLGVSSILIDPENPDRMWIGTGEMYSNGVVKPGAINRFTRGTYGIGILRTEDGGKTWSPSLAWDYGQMKGVQQLAMNPQNRMSLWAATSEGLYRSWDGGNSWIQAFQVPMAVDLYIHPQDTNLILVTTGSYFTQNAGLYRSINGGGSFAKVTIGIPGDYTGKAMMAGAPSDPDVLYAYVADALQGRGLYRSDNGGSVWTLVNSMDISQWQGWYSHDLAVDPADPEHLVIGGIDVHVSHNGGEFLIQQGIWEAGAYGKIPAGGPEGPPYYVHADIHGVYFHPADAQHVWLATDGGLFVSEDGGNEFQGRNGGYQTQQFYARFSNSEQDPSFALGGLQDNATVIYEGDTEWIKVIGGDGMSTAIDPGNDERLLASLPQGVFQRSLDRGFQFAKTEPPFAAGELRPFNTAISLVPGQADRVLTGGQRLYRSDLFAAPGSWEPLQDAYLDGSNMVTQILVSQETSQRVYVVTSSDPVWQGALNTGKLLLSNQGGEGNVWQVASGWPNRYNTCLTIHPQTPAIMLATFGGFGAPPLYRSDNGGISWLPWGNGLPPIPANSVVFDPFEPTHVYLGNDLGVYVSTDEGANWSPFSKGLPDACLVMDLAVSRPKKVLRAATHGAGAWEVPLLSQPNSRDIPVRSEIGKPFRIYPNPASGPVWLEAVHGREWVGDVVLWDSMGRKVIELAQSKHPAIRPILLSTAVHPGLHYLEVRCTDGRWVLPLVIR